MVDEEYFIDLVLTDIDFRQIEEGLMLSCETVIARKTVCFGIRKALNGELDAT